MWREKQGQPCWVGGGREVVGRRAGREGSAGKQVDLVSFAVGREGATWGPGQEPHYLVCRALSSLLGLLVGEELPVAQSPRGRRRSSVRLMGQAGWGRVVGAICHMVNRTIACSIQCGMDTCFSFPGTAGEDCP